MEWMDDDIIVIRLQLHKRALCDLCHDGLSRARNAPDVLGASPERRERMGTRLRYLMVRRSSPESRSRSCGEW